MAGFVGEVLAQVNGQNNFLFLLTGITINWPGINQKLIFSLVTIK